MKRSTLSIILILLIFTSSLFAGNKKPDYRLNLDSGWSYSLVENSTFFTPIDNEYFNQLSTLFKNHQGYVYLKKSFVLPEGLKNKELGLYIGQIKIASEIYINGTQICHSGYFPPNEFYSGEKPVYCRIPASCLSDSDEENTLLIKLWVNSYGRIGENPYIDEYPKLEISAELNSMISSKLPYSTSIFLMFISFLYIFFYFIRPVDKSNLSFGILTLFSSFYLFTVSWGEYPVTPQTSFLFFQQLFNGLVPYTTMFFAISFIRDYLGDKEKNWLHLFRIVIFAVICIVPFFAKTIWQFTIIQVIGYLLSGFMFIYPVIIILEAFFKKNKKVISLLIGFSPVLLSLVIAIILITTIDFKFPVFVIIFGWQLTILIFLGMLLVNYVTLFSKFEFINANLEKIVKSKTQELQTANQVLEETNTHLEYEQNRTKKELKLAAHVQQNFYSLRQTDFKDWEIGYYFKPLESVSGDLYDLYLSNDKLKGLGVFDVSGHGISSGLVTMLVKNIIQQEFFEGTNDELSNVLYKINERVIKEKGSIENYLTGIICRINENTLEYVSAGHPEPIFAHNSNVELIKKADTSQCGVIGIGGIPTYFASQKIEFESGDTFILYTDGITEAQNPDNKLFGKQNLIESIKKHLNLPVQDLIENIIEDVINYMDNTEVKDDMTMLVLRRK